MAQLNITDYIMNIGEGGSGEIKLNSQGDAVKIIRNSSSFIPEAGTLMEIAVNHEVSLHPNHHSLIVDKGHQVLDDDTLIVYPLADMDLNDYIKQNTLSELEIKRILYQIGVGIAELHNLGVVHLDIKPTNILIKDDTPLISDYGSAQWYCHSVTSFKITAVYASYEVLKGMKVDQKADVWSFGVMIIWLLKNDFIFLEGVGVDLAEIITDAIERRGYITHKPSYGTKSIKEYLEDNFKKELVDLLLHIFTLPSTRYNIFQVINDPYFDEVRTTNLKELSCLEINIRDNHTYPEVITRWGNEDRRREVCTSLSTYCNILEFLTTIDVMDRYMQPEWQTESLDYSHIAYIYVSQLLTKTNKQEELIQPNAINFIRVSGLVIKPYSLFGGEVINNASMLSKIGGVVYTLVTDTEYPTMNYRQRLARLFQLRKTS